MRRSRRNLKVSNVEDNKKIEKFTYVPPRTYYCVFFLVFVVIALIISSAVPVPTVDLRATTSAVTLDTSPRNSPDVPPGVPAVTARNPADASVDNDVVWLTVVGDDVRRNENVKRIQKLIPSLFVYKQMSDAECRVFLDSREIVVAAGMSDQVGPIPTRLIRATNNRFSAGKINHWCSYIRAMEDCVYRCVWIEDDVLLNKHHIDLIHSALELPIVKALMEFSGKGYGDWVVIMNAKLKHLLLDHVHTYGIWNPTDMMFQKLGYYGTVPKHLRFFAHGNLKSTIYGKQITWDEYGVANMHPLEPKTGGSWKSKIVNQGTATWDTFGRDTVKSRTETLGNLLNERKASVGVELGVQKGIFASKLLKLWTHVSLYVLVDIWQTQEHYVDGANSQDQQQNYKTAVLNTKPWPIQICRNFTNICAKTLDMRFDFIYVDARHDYQGVTQDLQDWFPKLKDGGIIAGHDYLTASDQWELNKNDNWEINMDGSKDITLRAVVGAVDDFFGLLNHPLQIIDTTIPWKTWVIDTTIKNDPKRIPKVLHFVWISVGLNEQLSIPTTVLKRIAAWKRLHSQWFVIIWTNKLVQKHFPTLTETLQKINTAAWISDIIRYHVLARYGGVYIDTDIEPLRTIPTDLLKSMFTVCEVYTGSKCVIACNAVIGARRSSETMKLVANKALQETRTKLKYHPQSRFDHTLTGPVLWSQFALHSGNILPSRSFYPCMYTDRSKCVLDHFKNDTDVIAMHLWSNSWG